MTQQQMAPKREIRRFDIFAEWNRLKGLERGKLSQADAKAYGLAVAKVVAARKFSGHDPAQAKELKRKAKDEDVGEPWWEHLGSAEEFARTVIARMGEEFYHNIFQPAVLQAWEGGQRYEEIRDALRESWNRQLREASKKPAR